MQKKCFVLEISRFLCFCEIPRLQNLWRHHRRCYIIKVPFMFFLTAIWPTLGDCWGDSLTHPMLITAVYVFDKVTGSLVTLAERLALFQSGTFWFLPQRLNALGHPPYAYIFWNLNTIKMKFGQIIVCCMTKTFLTYFWFNARDWKLVSGPFMILLNW